MNREADELFKKADAKNIAEQCLKVAEKHQPWCPERIFIERAKKCACNTNVLGNVRISGI